MKIAHTALGKSVKASVEDKAVRRKVWTELRRVITHLGLYSEDNKTGVMLSNDLIRAFSWQLSPQGHRYWESVYYRGIEVQDYV